MVYESWQKKDLEDGGNVLVRAGMVNEMNLGEGHKMSISLKKMDDAMSLLCL